jgi:anti-sigma factor RsiW
VAAKPQIESLVQGYLDDELSPSERTLFERAVAASPQLADDVARGREVNALLYESLGTHKLSRDLTAGVMAHLPEMEGGTENQRQEIAREVTWRTKHPERKTSWMWTMVSVLAPVAVVVLGFAIFRAWPGAEMQPRVVAMLTALDGKARIHDDAALATRDASLLSALHAGDTVETAEEGNLVLSLPGPTVIKTPESSRLKVIGPRAVQLEKGRAWLSVAKGTERFRVRTALGDITVFGTIFSVEVQADHVFVTLQEGEVTVENRKDFTVLYPNEQAVIARNESEIEKQQVDALALHAWADQLVPNPAAMAQSLDTLGSVVDNIIHAEQVWWVDTRGRDGVRAMAFTWEAASALENPMSYDVLVYNENMQPLFSRKLDGSLLVNPTARQVELQIPEGERLGGTATFVRLVPDENSGDTEVSFKEVSLIGNATATP